MSKNVRVTATVSVELLEFYKRLGGGNLSRGLFVAYELVHRTNQTVTSRDFVVPQSEASVPPKTEKPSKPMTMAEIQRNIHAITMQNLIDNRERLEAVNRSEPAPSHVMTVDKAHLDEDFMRDLDAQTDAMLAQMHPVRQAPVEPDDDPAKVWE